MNKKQTPLYIKMQKHANRAWSIIKYCVILPVICGPNSFLPYNRRCCLKAFLVSYAELILPPHSLRPSETNFLNQLLTEHIIFCPSRIVLVVLYWRFDPAPSGKYFIIIIMFSFFSCALLIGCKEAVVHSDDGDIGYGIDGPVRIW